MFHCTDFSKRRCRKLNNFNASVFKRCMFEYNWAVMTFVSVQYVFLFLFLNAMLHVQTLEISTNSSTYNLLQAKNNQSEIQENPEYSKSFLDLIFLILQNFDGKCSQDLIYLIHSRKERWAALVLDSFGKPVSGILKGRLSFPGIYDNCVNAVAPPKVNESSGFHGKYCSAKWSVTAMGKQYDFDAGVCFPNSCSVREIDRILEIARRIVVRYQLGLSFHLNGVDCDTYKYKPEILTANPCWFICKVFVLLVLIGTVIDINRGYVDRKCLISKNKQERTEKDGEMVLNSAWNHNIVENILFCFSATRNATDILFRPNLNHLSCLDGLKAISVIWVIVGNFYIKSTPYWFNLEDVAVFASLGCSSILHNYYFTTDSFFLFGGFLVTFKYFTSARTSVRTGYWISFYIHRYTRLMPSFFALFFIYTSLMPSLNSGPFWNRLDPSKCSNNFIYYLFSLNNFVRECYSCLPWTFQVAKHFQFFLVSPVILVFLEKSPVKTLKSLIVLILLSIVFTAVSSFENGNISLFEIPRRLFSESSSLTEETINKTYELIYLKPHSCFPSYILGMMTGYLHSIIHKKEILIRKCYVRLSWIASLLIIMVLIFGFNNYEISIVQAAALNSLSSIAWSVALSWILIACLNDYGGYLNRILSIGLWFPLSRLSYTCFLTSPALTEYFFYSLPTHLNFTKLFLSLFIPGFIVLSLIISFIFSLLFEIPFIKIVSLFRSPVKKQTKNV